jgi:hypothetical protein
VARFILPAPPVVPIAAADDMLALIRQLTLDPAYQLK